MSPSAAALVQAFITSFELFNNPIGLPVSRLILLSYILYPTVSMTFLKQQCVHVISLLNIF